MVRAKLSPRRSLVNYRPTTTKRVVTSMALNKATKALSTVSASTQRGNIKVVVRVRPPNNRESTANSRIVVHAIDSHMVVFDPPDDDGNDFYFKGVRQAPNPSKTRNKNTKFAFDNVYGPLSNNEQIFGDIIKPIIETLLNGFNCSVFAYGATGSGKTYTMIGTKENPGLTFQTVMELYKRLSELDNEYESEVVVSYLEVYNETVKDLLVMSDENSKNSASNDLQIREDVNGVMVANLSRHRPKDSTDLLELLARGNSVRSQHPTDHNAESSRSHAVFQVFINLRSRFTELNSKYKSAKLVMVDLAGSERGSATGFQGQRYREGASINKSLLSLGNCINALADGKKHIPYRDSKLTRILKDSLGGNCKTVMIANVSPSSLSYDDSYNTLKYADRAKRIKCQVKKNTMSVSACLTQYTKVVEEMSRKIEQLQNELDSRKECKCQLSSKETAGEYAPDPNAQLNSKSNDENRVPQNVLENIEALIEQKHLISNRLCELVSSISHISVRLEIKKIRIKTIQKLKAYGVEKSVSKVKKQIDNLDEVLSDEKAKKNQTQLELESINQRLDALKQEAMHGYVNVPFCTFVESGNFKIEKKSTDSLNRTLLNVAKYYRDQWYKNENMLGNAIEFSSSQYLLNKHHNNNSKEMDDEFQNMKSGLCGTRVQWSGDLCLETDPPYLRTLMNVSTNSSSGGPCPQEDPQDTYLPVAGRIQTPPASKRKITGVTFGDLDETMESFMLDSKTSSSMFGSILKPQTKALNLEVASEMDIDTEESTLTRTTVSNNDTITVDTCVPNLMAETASENGNLNETVTISEPVISSQSSAGSIDSISTVFPSELLKPSADEEAPVPCFLPGDNQFYGDLRSLKYLSEERNILHKENIKPTLSSICRGQEPNKIESGSADATFSVQTDETSSKSNSKGKQVRTKKDPRVGPSVFHRPQGQKPQSLRTNAPTVKTPKFRQSYRSKNSVTPRMNRVNRSGSLRTDGSSIAFGTLGNSGSVRVQFRYERHDN